MYIGFDTNPYPYNNEELRKKFPSIKQELIGFDIGGLSYYHVPLHVIKLKALSKYYTGSSEEK